MAPSGHWGGPLPPLLVPSHQGCWRYLPYVLPIFPGLQGRLWNGAVGKVLLSLGQPFAFPEVGALPSSVYPKGHLSAAGNAS